MESQHQPPCSTVLTSLHIRGNRLDSALCPIAPSPGIVFVASHQKEHCWKRATKGYVPRVMMRNDTLHTIVSPQRVARGVGAGFNKGPTHSASCVANPN